MQQNNVLKKLIINMCGELVALFAYKNYNILHLASLRESSITKEKKRLLKLSKKVLNISVRLSNDIIENDNIIVDNVQLLYEVYNHIDDLTKKELNILREFCYLLKQTNSFNLEKKIDIKSYYQYIDVIDNSIELKKSENKTQK